MFTLKNRKGQNVNTPIRKLYAKALRFLGFRIPHIIAFASEDCATLVTIPHGWKVVGTTWNDDEDSITIEPRWKRLGKRRTRILLGYLRLIGDIRTTIAAQHLEYKDVFPGVLVTELEALTTKSGAEVLVFSQVDESVPMFSQCAYVPGHETVLQVGLYCMNPAALAFYQETFAEFVRDLECKPAENGVVYFSTPNVS